MATMKAVGIKDGKGPIENLFIEEVSRPKVTGAQALIKVKAFGLNRMDLMQREGHYPVPPSASKTLGVEFSGIIEELGGESEGGFKKGDAVFGLAYGGAYAEYIAVSTHMLIHKPDELSWEECAGIPEVWATALQAMYLVGDFAPGKSILWHAGASSVSIAGQQLSKAYGASKIFATARSDEKCDFCVKSLGATAAFNTKTTKNWDEEVRKATDDKGVDVIIDFIGADTFSPNLNAAARDARIVLLAFMSGGVLKDQEINISTLLFKRIRVEGSSLRSRDEGYQGKLRDKLAELAMPKFIDGTFKLHVEKVFPWTEIQDAHRLMESNATKGKLICVIP